MAFQRRADLLHSAQQKTQALLQSLQRDQAEVVDYKDGKSVYEQAVDSARRTLENVNRALQDADHSTGSD